MFKQMMVFQASTVVWCYWITNAL